MRCAYKANVLIKILFFTRKLKIFLKVSLIKKACTCGSTILYLIGCVCMSALYFICTLSEDAIQLHSKCKSTEKLVLWLHTKRCRLQHVQKNGGCISTSILMVKAYMYAALECLQGGIATSKHHTLTEV